MDEMTAMTADPNYERRRFVSDIELTFKKCLELIVSKNGDYTRINPDDPFYNFRQESVEYFLRAKKVTELDGTTIGLLARLNDKRRRRENLILTGKREVYTENIEDTILDEINYLAILLAHFRLHGYNASQEVKTQEKIELSPTLDTVIDAFMNKEKYLNDIIEHLRNQLDSIKADHKEELDILRKEKRNVKRTNKRK